MQKQLRFWASFRVYFFFSVWNKRKLLFFWIMMTATQSFLFCICYRLRAKCKSMQKKSSETYFSSKWKPNAKYQLVLCEHLQKARAKRKLFYRPLCPEAFNSHLIRFRSSIIKTDAYKIKSSSGKGRKKRNSVMLRHQ